jgi:hypothetical protein
MGWVARVANLSELKITVSWLSRDLRFGVKNGEETYPSDEQKAA